MSDKNSNPKPGQSAPAILPQLQPLLARRCRECGAAFETRFYGLEHCVRCSLRRLQAASAYARHESAWEERQRAAHARLMAALALAAAQKARRAALCWQVAQWVALAAGVLLALDWIGR